MAVNPCVIVVRVLQCDHFTGAMVAEDTIGIPVIGALRRECEGADKPYGRAEGARERGERLSDCSCVVRIFQIEMNSKNSKMRQRREGMPQVSLPCIPLVGNRWMEVSVVLTQDVC